MKLIATLLLCSTAILTLTFQNCAKYEFATAPVELSSSAEVSEPQVIAPGIFSKTITVADTTISTAFKVLIVVDNSYTMNASQQKVAANLDSLLTPLKGKDVEVKVITTTEYYGSLDEKSEDRYVRADETVKSYPGDKASSYFVRAEYSDPQYVRVEQVTNYLEAKGTVVRFASTDSQGAVNASIDAVKTAIMAAGVGGADNEQSLCPISRHLRSSAGGFFENSKKAALIVLSDEDDSSHDCTVSRMSTYGSLKTTNGMASEYYQFDVQIATASFSYDVIDAAQYRDGILIAPESRRRSSKTFAFYVTDISPSDVTSGACPAKAEAILRARGSSDYSTGERADFTTATVTGCAVGAAYGSWAPPTPGNINYCDTNQRYNGKNISELAYGLSLFTTGAYNVGSGVYAGNCRRNLDPGTSSTSRPNAGNSMKSAFVSQTTIVQELAAQLKAKFGNQFFMSMIVNPTSGSCQLAQGQGIGARYQALVNQDPQRFSVFPICSSSYAAALSKVSEFIQTVAQVTSYKHGMPANAKITEMKLIRANGTTVLKAQDYRLAGDNLELLFALQSGDRISWTYTAP